MYLLRTIRVYAFRRAGVKIAVMRLSKPANTVSSHRARPYPFRRSFPLLLTPTSIAPMNDRPIAMA
jgi:hypothetical protein